MISTMINRSSMTRLRWCYSLLSLFEFLVLSDLFVAAAAAVAVASNHHNDNSNRHHRQDSLGDYSSFFKNDDLDSKIKQMTAGNDRIVFVVDGNEASNQSNKMERMFQNPLYRTMNNSIIRKSRSRTKQRKLQSCVSSAAALAAAVKRGLTTVRVCSSTIKLGSLNRRRHRNRRYLLNSATYNNTNVTLTGLAGGIDVSNRTIVFTCLLKKRCTLDGESISRIFYGTNARIMMDGFQFLNASSAGDSLGSGSALALIGSSHVTLRDTSFLYNTAPNGGGAIMIINSTLILQNSRRKIQFYKNEASYGGAIFGFNATIQTNITSSSGVKFQDNSASKDSGALLLVDSTVILNQVTMEDNNAANGGAAVFIDTNVTMNKIYATGNTAQLTGGAFVFLECDVVITNSTFDTNNGNGTVEAVTVDSSNVIAINSTFPRSRWYTLSSNLILTNSCLPQGSNCDIGTSCNDCCKPYQFWDRKAGYFCGPEPPKKCFGSDGFELYYALIDYVTGNAAKIATLTYAYGNISDWCTSAVADWSYMFQNLDTFNENITTWNTSNAINMQGTFYGAAAFNQDISRWDTSKVPDMSSMFYLASSFNQDITTWNTSNVITMRYLFYKAAAFNQDISKWDTSKVQDMSYMFYQASSFNQDITTWNTSNAILMLSTFLGAAAFNQDISRWDTSKVQDMSYMFYEASSFNQDISSLVTSQVTDMSYMFQSALTFNQDISKWDTSSVQDMKGMFARSSFNQDISKWDVSSVRSMFGMFQDNTIFNGNITSWNVSQMVNMGYMFYSAISFNQDISGWDISNVRFANVMFYNASAFNQNLCAWDNKCSNLQDASNAFVASNCPNLSSPICGSGPFCYSC